jgi:hypothetical protein
VVAQVQEASGTSCGGRVSATKRQKLAFQLATHATWISAELSVQRVARTRNVLTMDEITAKKEPRTFRASAGLTYQFRLAKPLLLVLAVVLVGCGRRKAHNADTPTITSDPTPAKSAWDTELAVSTLRAAYRAYLLEKDVARLFALWDPSLEVRAARTRERADKEVVFDRAKFKAVYVWAAEHQPQIVKLSISEPHTELSKGDLIVEWQVRIKTATQESAFGERYVLSRRGSGFAVVQFRYWPLLPDTLREFGSEYFDVADREVAEARARGDVRATAYRLFTAYRFAEASEEIRKFCDDNPTDAWAWGMRAMTSAMIGDLDDAKSSQRKADALDAGY